MKVICSEEQNNLTENKLYKVVKVRPMNRTMFYKVMSDDNKLRWYNSGKFRYPINKF
jgi:hypothetical protein